MSSTSPIRGRRCDDVDEFVSTNAAGAKAINCERFFGIEKRERLSPRLCKHFGPIAPSF